MLSFPNENVLNGFQFVSVREYERLSRYNTKFTVKKATEVIGELDVLNLLFRPLLADIVMSFQATVS